MKRTLYILLFIGFYSFAQSISPYYPTKQEMAYKGYEPTQLTYYDDQYVQGAIMNFVYLYMGMVQIELDKPRVGDSYIMGFQDKFSTGKLYAQLFFSEIDVDIINPVVVTSIKITGDANKVISFFVHYWGTTYKVEDVNADIERNHLQDKINFYFNNGKPYIEVVNSTYKDTAKFTTKFKELLAQ